MADLKKMQESVKMTIRSLLISTKDGLTRSQLVSDYMSLMGHPVPFQKLGHGSVDEMLNAMPDVCRRTL